MYENTGRGLGEGREAIENKVAKRGFKRGILRDLELINAEGEAGEGGGGGSREDVGETPRVRGVKRGCR